MTNTLTDRGAMAIAWCSVGGEISNMLDISLPVAWRWQSLGDQLPSCPINRPYPQGDWQHNQWHDRPSVANCVTDHTKVARWVWPFKLLT